MRKVLILAIALALPGCGATNTYKNYVQDDKNPVDPNVNVTCDLVPETPPRSSDFGEVYEFANDMVGLYGVCALRDKAKADWIKSQGH